MKKGIINFLSVVAIILIVNTGCKKKTVDEGDCDEELQSAEELYTQYNNTDCDTANKKAACEAFKSAANELLASCSEGLSDIDRNNIQDLIDDTDCNIPCEKD